MENVSIFSLHLEVQSEQQAALACSLDSRADRRIDVTVTTQSCYFAVLERFANLLRPDSPCCCRPPLITIANFRVCTASAGGLDGLPRRTFKFIQGVCKHELP